MALSARLSPPAAPGAIGSSVRTCGAISPPLSPPLKKTTHTSGARTKIRLAPHTRNTRPHGVYSPLCEHHLPMGFLPAAPPPFFFLTILIIYPPVFPRIQHLCASKGHYTTLCSSLGVQPACAALLALVPRRGAAVPKPTGLSRGLRTSSCSLKGGEQGVQALCSWESAQGIIQQGSCLFTAPGSGGNDGGASCGACMAADGFSFPSFLGERGRKPSDHRSKFTFSHSSSVACRKSPAINTCCWVSAWLIK